MAPSDWTIEDASGEPILGNTERPSGEPRGVVLLVHGFMGYKDYGMFPYLARAFARAGFVAHRFNLSHSGMTDDIDSFARPDLFERNTWNRQVEDIDRVIGAIDDGTIGGVGLPVVLFGHSRGGVASILAAGRRARRGQPVACVITASSPSRACSMSDEDQRSMLEQGFTTVRSNRTGQDLRIDARWLREQLDDPEAHDVLAHARDLACPLLVVHGMTDPTVPRSCASEIAESARDATLELIENADHVFRTPNPFDPAGMPSPELERLAQVSTNFAAERCG